MFWYILLQFAYSASAATEEQVVRASKDCGRISRYLEGKYKLPPKLLHAIMLVESSGKPYAVYCNKRSYQFTSLSDASSKVKDLSQQGYRNINVGPMQLNLQFHRPKSIEEFFDPYTNIDYAARFLMKLKDELGNWNKAVRYYHSGSKTAFHASYVQKINRHLVSCRLEEM